MKAVIFDMDGVLLDTQKCHAEVESVIFKDLGIEISEKEITQRFAGMSLEDEFGIVLRECGKSANLEEIRRKKNEMYSEKLKQGIDEIPGMLSVVKWLKRKTIPVAIATTTKSDIFSIIDAQMEFFKLFDAVVLGDEVKNSKPAPDIFLEAAKRLGVPPKDCVVVEDGKSGIEGARKAGMKTVGFGVSEANFFAKTASELRALLEDFLKNEG